MIKFLKKVYKKIGDTFSGTFPLSQQLCATGILKTYFLVYWLTVLSVFLYSNLARACAWLLSHSSSLSSFFWYIVHPVFECRVKYPGLRRVTKQELLEKVTVELN